LSPGDTIRGPACSYCFREKLATCPAGFVAISGGFVFGGIILDDVGLGYGWRATGYNELANPITLYTKVNGHGSARHRAAAAGLVTAEPNA
jgi:hypothetical protein